ncbi:hypothetical protein [Streptomyces sp. CS014]|nr:hypothetical protein [Streptomyces sp. CS014]
MTTRILRRLRLIALRTLRTLRRTALTPYRAPAPPRHGCTPPCGDRFLA